MNKVPDNSPSLEYFKVEGLHNRQDVGLSMTNSIGIFIADNGSGKTTVLYMLHCILSKKFTKLAKYQYDRIYIKFSGEDVFVITPADYAISRSGSFLRNLRHRTDLDFEQISQLITLAHSQHLSMLRVNSLFRKAANGMRLPSAVLAERLMRLPAFDDRDLLADIENSPFSRLRDFLDKKFAHSVLYLPTYRRVEQDVEELLDLDQNERDLTSTDIHFGMRDVDERINRATRNIRDHFISSYGMISGQMLGQLAESSPISPEALAALEDRSQIELVLGRVAENVSQTQKELILKLYDDGELATNVHLSFFLYSLIQAYEQVRQVDAALQRYAKVCNGYLINKEMRYDSLNATVAVYEMPGGRPLKLETLSSGEKQILGVMSELYLGSSDSYIIIFDEPELSLSMDWQKKILVDISASDKTHTLVAVTHSPFVFENALDAYAKSLEVSFHAPVSEAANGLA